MNKKSAALYAALFLSTALPGSKTRFSRRKIILMRSLYNYGAESADKTQQCEHVFVRV